MQGRPRLCFALLSFFVFCLFLFFRRGYNLHEEGDKSKKAEGLGD